MQTGFFQVSLKCAGEAARLCAPHFTPPLLTICDHAVIDRIRQFFSRQEEEILSGGGSEHALRMATATLLVEMSRADRQVDDTETDAVLAAIRQRFDLAEQEARDLADLGHDRADHATSLYEFTRVLNEQLSREQKLHIVELLWDVAYADGRIDKYEEQLVRKIAELIYVPHPDFIAAKLRAEARVS